ncbi:MAG: hypothetical protein ABL901_14540 [Hyphomicrobiaceae bacterium]
MLSDDVFRAQLSTTFADLLRTAERFTDVADLGQAQTREFVRLSMMPHARGACAVEIMLRADQHYDIAIGTEFYEDCRIQRFETFVPLIEAIAQGDVIQRRHVSAITGTERSIETLVQLPGGDVWRKGHDYTVALAIPDDGTLFDDRRYVAYRR